MVVKQVVLAGPPGGGKSVTLRSLKHLSVSEKWEVIYLQEVATEFLKDMPVYIASHMDYITRQFVIWRTQEFLQRQLLENATRNQKAKNLLLIADRGVWDLMAYLSQDEKALIMPDETEWPTYEFVLYFDRKDISALDRHSNPARIESNESEWKLVAQRTRMAWEASAIPLTVIPMFDDVQDKVRYTALKINELLGDFIFIEDEIKETKRHEL